MKELNKNQIEAVSGGFVSGPIPIDAPLVVCPLPPSDLPVLDRYNKQPASPFERADIAARS